jgi:hypothetical protein
MSYKKTNKKAKSIQDTEENYKSPFDEKKYVSMKVSELQTRNLQDTEMVKTFIKSVQELNEFGHMVLDELMAQRDELVNLKSIIKNPHKVRQKKLTKFKVAFHTLKQDFEDPPSSGAV